MSTIEYVANAPVPLVVVTNVAFVPRLCWYSWSGKLTTASQLGETNSRTLPRMQSKWERHVDAHLRTVLSFSWRKWDKVSEALSYDSSSWFLYDHNKSSSSLTALMEVVQDSRNTRLIPALALVVLPLAALSAHIAAFVIDSASKSGSANSL